MHTDLFQKWHQREENCRTTKDVKATSVTPTAAPSSTSSTTAGKVAIHKQPVHIKLESEESFLTEEDSQDLYDSFNEQETGKNYLFLFSFLCVCLFEI